MTSRPSVLITGASGLIGTRLARALAPDYPVIGMDLRVPDGDYPESASFVQCNLTSDRSVEEALDWVRAHASGPLASVVHLAAHYDFSGEPSPLYETLTVEGTRRLLRALQGPIRTEQFVFTSSLLVMKPAEEGEVLSESSPVQAEWDYPASKLAAEAVIEQERGRVPVVVLRLAGVYDDEGHSPPLTQQIWRIRERKLESFFFPGDATHGQSFVHIDDAVGSICAAIERRDRLSAHETFLIGEPEVMSYAELQDRIGERVHGREWPTVRIPSAVAKAGAWIKGSLPLGDDGFIKPWMIDLADASYPVSIERARTRLGWQPRFRLRERLPTMIENLRRDPGGWYDENGLPIEDSEPPSAEIHG